MTTTIRLNTDLAAGSSSIKGWETCAAASYNVAVYTGNWFAAYSTDSGGSFKSMDPAAICNVWGESLCCDQVVIYVPQIDAFVWVLQTNTGNYILAVANPGAVAQSGDQAWTSYQLKATTFDPAATLDYPEVAVGTNYLYLTCNMIGKNSLVVRIPVQQLGTPRISFQYVSLVGSYWVRPAQNADTTASFACFQDTSTVRVYRWPESSNAPWWFDTRISTIPTEDFAVTLPSGDVWLGPTSKVDWHIYGATHSDPQTLWIAWNGARRVSGQTNNAFAYPHIGIARIGIGQQSGGLLDQKYIWNPNLGFAWPALATNNDGDVGLGFCFAGPSNDAQHGVAMLTVDHTWSPSFVATTSGKSWSAGGHYISVRPYYPPSGQRLQSLLCAAGFNGPINGTDRQAHPHFVLFGL